MLPMTNNFKRKWAMPILGALLAALLLAGCAPKAPGAAAKPIRIGAALSTTGAWGDLGLYNKVGIELAVKEINDKGGIKSLGGAPIEVVWAEVESDAKKAIAETERLMTTENISLLIGGTATGEGMAIGLLGDKYKVPIISISTPDPIFDQNPKFFVSLRPPAREMGGSYAYLMHELITEFKLPYKTVAIVTADDAAGRLYNEGMKAAIAKLGAPYSAVLNLALDPRAPDHTVSLLKIKAANPDVVLNQGVPATANSLGKARVAHNYTSPLWFGLFSACSSRKIWLQIPPEVATAALVRPEIYCLDTYAENEKFAYKPFQDWLAKAEPFAKAKGLVADNNVALGSQALYAAYKAIEAAGSRDSIAVNDGLHKLSLKMGDPMLIYTYFGEALEWEASGKPKKAELMLLQWNKNGQDIEAIYPKKYRTAEPWLKK